MKIELEPEQLTALIEHLGALTIRYEMEAAAYASVGTTGRRWRRNAWRQPEKLAPCGSTYFTNEKRPARW